MLTPSSNDPNFENEKLRRAKDPKSFGAMNEKIVEDKLAARKKRDQTEAKKETK